MRSIGIRLFLAFLCVVVFLVAQGIVAIRNAGYVIDVQHEAMTEEMALDAVRTEVGHIRLVVYRLLGTMDPTEMDRLRDEYETASAGVLQTMTHLQLDLHPFEEMQKTYAEAIKLHYDFSPRLARNLMEGESHLEFSRMMEYLSTQSEARVAASNSRVLQCQRQGQRITVSLAAAAVGVSLLWALILRRTLTDRAQAEEALRVSESRYRTIVETAAEGVCSIDLTGRVLFVNQLFADMLGYETDEVVGRPITDFQAPGDAAEFSTHLKLRKEGKGEQYIARYQRRDGEEITALMNASPAFDEKGRPSSSFAMITDITGHVRIQEELRESRARYQRLYENALAGLGRIRVSDGRMLDANPRFAEMYGFASVEECLSEFRGRNVYADEEVRDRLAREILEEGCLNDVEVQYRRKDGSTFWGRLSVQLDRATGCVEGVIIDVSRQKEAEEALSQSEEKYRSLFEQSSDAQFILAGEIFVDCNDAAVSILGYDNKAQIIGLRPSELSPDFQPSGRPSDEEAERRIATAVEKGHVVFEWEHQRRDGSPFFVEVMLTAIPFQGERTFHCALRDMTERHRAEDELRRLRSLLSNIIDSMPSVLVGVDREGRVTQWNRQAEQTTGRPADAAEGLLLPEIFPELARQMESVKKAVETRQPQHETRVPWKPAGESRLADVTVYPLVGDGVEGAVIRVDDVTERARLEEMMVQSEKMLSVGGLAAGMAHEINNPLAAIIQSVQVIRNRVFTDLPANLAAAERCGLPMDALHTYVTERGLNEMLDAVMEAGKRAARIVGNMLTFSRKSEPVFERHDLVDLLDRAIELCGSDYDLRKKFDFRHIEIVREYQPDVPPVFCEGTEVQQVFLNLLKNAAQAMADRADDDRPSQMYLRVRHDEGFVLVEIEDNGPGMDADTRKRVFEPFFTTKPVGVGTGLGLSVSYFIITENHRGSMSAESTPGKGTTFIVRLPVG